MKTDSNTAQNMIMLAVAVAVGYGLWKAFWAVKQTVQAGTNAVAGGIANLWLTMTAPPGVGSVLGNALLPDGSFIPMRQLPLKGMTDSGGTFHLYTQYNGAYYELQPSDINGDFPAVAVS